MTRGGPGPKKGDKQKAQTAKEYLIAHPRATTQQVMDACGVSPRTVSYARRYLMDRNLIPRNFHDHSSPSVFDPPKLASETPKTEENEDATAEDPVSQIIHSSYSPNEMRSQLVNVAKRAAVDGNGALEIAAIKAINTLDRQDSDRDRLGPPPPLTEKDKVERLGVLMEVCGPDIGAKAAARAYHGSDWERFSESVHAEEKTDASSEQEAGEMGESGVSGLEDDQEAVPGVHSARERLDETAPSEEESPI